MHIIIVALHHPKTYKSTLKSIQEKSAQDKLNHKTPSYELYQLESDFKSTKIQALEELSRFFQDIVNKYQEGEIKNVSILTDFNLGFSTTLSSPIPLLDKYINTEFTDKHKQRFQTQNKNTSSAASSIPASSSAASSIPASSSAASSVPASSSAASSVPASSSAQAPSLIPVNLYFTGSGTTPDLQSGMPQHTVKEIMALYGTGRGDVTSFLATSRPSSARPGSRSSMTSPSLGSRTSPSLGGMTSPSLGGMTSPIIDSRGQTPQHTIRKHSSADDANVPNFPQLPSSLSALSDSASPRAASASASSGGSALFREYSSASSGDSSLFREYSSASSGDSSLFREYSSASAGDSSLFPRESSSASSYGVYEEFTPSSSAAAATAAAPRNLSALSAAFLSPNSYRGDDEDELTAVTEEMTEELTEEINAAALAGPVPTTPVSKKPEHSIIGFLAFNREINAKSPVVSPAASPLKTRPGLFGTRSCSTTPVPSPIKSDTPSPQRPVLTIEVDEVADVDHSLNQLKL